MIRIRKPYGAISEYLLMDVCEKKGKYFVVDNIFNRYETTKEEYERCKELLK